MKNELKQLNIESLKPYYIGHKDYTECKYAVMLHDDFLSGWGGSGEKGHYQIVLCRDYQEAKQMEKASRNKDHKLTFTKCYNLEKEPIYFENEKTYRAKMLIECPLFMKG